MLLIKKLKRFKIIFNTCLVLTVFIASCSQPAPEVKQERVTLEAYCIAENTICPGDSFTDVLIKRQLIVGIRITNNNYKLLQIPAVSWRKDVYYLLPEIVDDYKMTRDTLYCHGSSISFGPALDTTYNLQKGQSIELFIEGVCPEVYDTLAWVYHIEAIPDSSRKYIHLKYATSKRIKPKDMIDHLENAFGE